MPVHDVQMVVDGEAAAALASACASAGSTRPVNAADERAAERSNNRGEGDTVASGKLAARAASSVDRWPSGVEPHFEHVPVGIIRTLGALEERTPEIREVERSTVAAIGRAEKLIYIENQYVTSKAAAEALLARMRANPALEAILVTSREPGGWLEAGTMGVGRQQFMALFDEPHLRRRIQFVYPFARGNPGDDEYPAPNNIGDGTFSIHVHAKVLIIDDTFMRIGSSNLNNRSMGFDTECDLGIEASTPDHRRAIAAVRNGLIAEHWGAEPAAVERALASGEPVIEALGALPAAASLVEAAAAAPGEGERANDDGRKRPRRWRARIARAMRGPGRSRPPVERGVAPVAREEPWRAVSCSCSAIPSCGDGRTFRHGGRRHQARPADPQMGARGRDGARADRRRGGAHERTCPGEGAGFTERVSASIEALRGNPWRVPLVLLIFVAGSSRVVPDSRDDRRHRGRARTRARVRVRGRRHAARGHAYVRHRPRDRPQAAAQMARPPRATARGATRRARHRDGRADAQGADRAVHVRQHVDRRVGLSYREFIAGTALGMLPGIAAFAFVGDRAIDAWREPTPLNVTLVAGAIVLWIGVVVGVQHLMNRFSKR